MGWLRTWRVNRAAKQYALRLPRRLKEGWGFSEYYTPGQIKAAVKKLGLNADFICLGYAAFLPEEQFDQIRADMPVLLSYQDARAAFDRYFRLDMWSAAWEPEEENPDANSISHNPH